MSRLAILIPVALIIVMIAALSACGEEGPAPTPEPTPVPWNLLPADGKCRSGLVLKPGESCVHEYSYQAGVSISASGARPVIEEVANEFSVDSDGVARYGDNMRGTSIKSSRAIGDIAVSFVAYVQSDGTFYIEEAAPSGPVASPAQPDAANTINCTIGMVLQPGESCALTGGEFYVEPDGSGCFGGFLCGGTGVTINNFSAKKNANGSWTIQSLP